MRFLIGLFVLMLIVLWLAYEITNIVPLSSYQSTLDKHDELKEIQEVHHDGL